VKDVDVPRISLPAVDIDVPAAGLTIGRAAAVLGIPSETLRYYDRAGLLRDPAPRNDGGQRRFQHADLEWIAAVIMLRETGMPIRRIREVAELSRAEGTEHERLEIFLAHRRHVLSVLERTHAHLDAIERKIVAYRDAIHQEEHQ
jgi:DNA-binding transcriptional MerR regulator